MSLSLGIVERLNRARGDLRMGVPVVLTEDGAGAVAVAVEALEPGRLADLRLLGEPVLAITARRAETLKARVYDDDLARIELPDAAGIEWLRAVADPADDLRLPMKGPLRALRGGGAGLARAALALAKSAHLLPAAVLVPVADPLRLAALHALTLLPLEEARAELSRGSPLHPVVSARVPMVASQAGRVHVFRPEDGGEEHYAIEIGRPDRGQPVLARLHSACFTGDVLGSLKCDCGPQLRSALARMGEEGAGVLLYLNQEGRGIGLANKMRAYSLQDQGFDTVEANHRLGFEDDERDFRIGAGILRQMGFAAVRLLTNNPAKIRMMEANGIRVTERVPLHVGRNEFNAAYLATKAAKSGHLA
ncbi:GTP cyclohydrolase II [Cereibacter johrii]|uniref:GTP cyclohydrolase-2 n=1 Tax=Cereibacter johrii TaxID=445629 RepID=A0ABX5J806_9RHOB|nr:GTP cyclohydrolase II [Cereibacter johrii]MEA5159713.1 GTP cyclohydrolase II [Cereibacter johrii]ODM43372.1 GTP cyclohydrolase II [Cereibacter johrii]PTM79316.1 GTP cyclohydrolase II [Cereibacter johrii]RAZ86266.1 GTP cyclohydrolase II [Cereibacter johrii]